MRSVTGLDCVVSRSSPIRRSAFGTSVITATVGKTPESTVNVSAISIFSSAESLASRDRILNTRAAFVRCLSRHHKAGRFQMVSCFAAGCQTLTAVVQIRKQYKALGPAEACKAEYCRFRLKTDEGTLFRHGYSPIASPLPSVHFIAFRIGSIRRTITPSWKTRTVPVDSETAIAIAPVALEMSAAAQ